MLKFCLLVIFIEACQCLSLLQLQREWSGWKKHHSKNYFTGEEENSRWMVWRKNYHKIMEHNKANHSFSLGLNQFADMTQKEFAQFYLSRPIEASNFPRSGILHEADKENEDPESDNGFAGYSNLDWRNKGYVTSIKNQGQCGSCWAFSATGALEGQMYRTKGSLVSLSEQQLVDCSWKYGNAGCNGGLMDYAFNYIKGNSGICSGSDYPYIGYMWRCRSSNCNSVGFCSGYVDIQSGSEDNLISAVSKYGPVSVAIDASSYGFQFYSNGVYYDSSCSASTLNHGVLVVGYGTSDNSNYWIVKNSWGTSWGSSGYIKMTRGQNMCGIASAASYPTVG